MRPLAWIVLALALAGSPFAQAQAPGPGPEQLQPGEFTWLPVEAPSGPLLLVVGLAEQRAYLYRNGIRIADSRVEAAGARPGVYVLGHKRQEHASGLYEDPPQPYALRLSWTGMALHATRPDGASPPAPAIRLPMAFARRLFDVGGLGMAVVVSERFAEVPLRVRPGWLAPTAPIEAGGLAAGESWAPGPAAPGPLTVLASQAEGSMRVLRDGVEIGRAPIRFDGAAPRGLVVLQLQSGHLATLDLPVPGGDDPLRWMQVPMAARDTMADGYFRGLHLSAAFAGALRDALVPGSVFVVAGEPLEAMASGAVLLEAGPEPGDAASADLRR